MIARVLRVAVTACSIVVAAACSRGPSTDAPAIALTSASDGRTSVTVTGLSERTLDAMESGQYTPGQWADILRVSVAAADPPIIGEHRIVDDALTFTPAFAFDPGRRYHVRFDPSRLPAGTGTPVTTTVGLAAPTAVPSTTVAHVYPSSETVPENLLRMYLEFSAPMGRPTGLPHIRLLDSSGEEVSQPFLPLDYEFWNEERTRFTVFFDPGRVKDDILPNRQMGRALVAGREYTLVIDQAWRDAQGRPLKTEHRRTLRATAADTQPLDTARWRIAPPAAGGRDPVVVTFPEPLDHGLLMRAVGVRRLATPLDGDVTVDASETRWSFRPTAPWTRGSYEIIALSILEDLAGNQIGRAFEVDRFDAIEEDPEPRTITIPFTIK